MAEARKLLLSALEHAPFPGHVARGLDAGVPIVRSRSDRLINRMIAASPWWWKLAILVLAVPTPIDPDPAAGPSPRWNRSMLPTSSHDAGQAEGRQGRVRQQAGGPGRCRRADRAQPRSDGLQKLPMFKRALTKVSLDVNEGIALATALRQSAQHRHGGSRGSWRRPG